MEMPKPGSPHQKLQRLSGKWIGEEKLHPSPWDPKGGMATARVHNRSSLDGFVVVQDYEQERGGQVNFRGHGVFSYDAVQQCYVMHWWDSMGMPPNEFKGNFVGDVLTFTGQNPQGISRATFDLDQEGTYKFKMEASQDGKQWHTFMEGSYAKEK